MKKGISSTETSFIDRLVSTLRPFWRGIILYLSNLQLAYMTSSINLMLSETDPGPQQHLRWSSLWTKLTAWRCRSSRYTTGYILFRWLLISIWIWIWIKEWNQVERKNAWDDICQFSSRLSNFGRRVSSFLSDSSHGFWVFPWCFLCLALFRSCSMIVNLASVMKSWFLCAKYRSAGIAFNFWTSLRWLFVYI